MVKWLINGLDNPVAWRASRWLLNLAFGLYNAGYLLLMHGTVARMPAWL